MTTISDDCKDFEVLTPSRFLIGAFSSNLTPGIFNNSESTIRNDGEMFKQL